VRVQPGADGSDGRLSGGGELLDRDFLLGLIDETLDAARRGDARALLLEAHAGMGKTRLYEAAIEAARARKLRVIRAAGAELENNLAFGVAAQLLRSLLSEVSPARRRALLADAPPPVLLLERPDPAHRHNPVADQLAVSHGLFTVLAGAADSSPALLAIDDLQWSDTGSLELILYVLHRLAELQIALVMTQRPPREDEAARDRLMLLAAHPKVRVEQLAPLGRDAVGELLHRQLGHPANASLIEVCQQATGGNPFYLAALLRALGDEGDLTAEELASRARSLVPEAVSRSLRVRVGRLGPEAGALARAVAVLGDDAPLRQAAALSGQDIAAAGRAADALAAAEVLLAQEPLRFVHPLVRQAIEQDIPASERASRHLDAARLMYDEGVAAERVAAHLLLGRAEGNPWVVDRLRAAARDARDSTALESAVTYLQRALAEPPSREERPELFGELGTAEAALGMTAAAEHLAAAIEGSADPLRRAELALELGRAYGGRGEHARAVRAFEQGLAELESESGEPELRDQLEAGLIATGTLVPALRPKVAEQASRWLATVPASPVTQGQRLLLAHIALEGAHVGEPAETIIDHAERAWDRGRILTQASSQWIGWRLVANALCCAGALERAAEVCTAASEDARRRGSPLGFATACFTRSSPRLLQGRINDAIADLEPTRDGGRYGWAQFIRGAAAKYALCLVETGQLDTAETALTADAPLQEPYDLEDAMRLVALAEVRRAQGRLEEALATALTAGRVAEETIPFFDYGRWRTSAAQSALGLGDREQAQHLAGEMLARAVRTGVVEHKIEALRVAGVCAGGSAGFAKLSEAVELGRSLPPRLETVRSMVELGAALRRANERAAARPYLQQAADLALAGGALVLYQHARTELSATGARPRREALLSGPASLTPSERRIAELAAGGHSNPQIASSLFVTPKTVEYHLRNAYRKLDIQTRGELPQALAGEAATGVADPATAR
jgi:DNA-binding CsgD family transcriptional regulator